MKKISIFLLLISTLCGCSLSSQKMRTPSSIDLALEEYDQIFNSKQRFKLEEIGGRVFECRAVSINPEFTEKVFPFSKIGFLPMHGKRLMITIGDGTNQGTVDSIAAFKDDQVSWSHKTGKILVRHYQKLNQLLVRSYVFVEGRAVLAESHQCSTRI